MNARLGALVCAAVLAAGCNDPITEVVLVMTSDLVIPNDVEMSTVGVVAGTDPPAALSGFQTNITAEFPLTVGVQAGHATVFSATIQLSRTDRTTFTNLPIVTRNVTAVRFVPEQIRMVVVPMPSACACHGTSCPLPGTNPDCDDLVSPEAVPLDPTIAPPSSPEMPGGFISALHAGGGPANAGGAAGGN
jgi:hypothetical protein